jgi:molybdate transport repressor ModE-like protein
MPRALKTRHLQVFLAVAKAGSMQHAAHEVHLSQPAISKLISELEGIFGAPLFERSKHGVTATECGLALLHRAQRMLNDFETTKSEVAAIASGSIGCVRLGILPVVEAPMLSRTLVALRKAVPGIMVQITDGPHTVLLSLLRKGELDCVISRLDLGSADQDLHTEKLVESPICVVANPSHPLAQEGRVSWSDLARYPWILPRQGAPIRTLVNQQFTDVGLVPPIPMIESTSVHLNQVIIAGTDMISVMNCDPARDYVRSRQLAILPVNFARQPPHIGVITHTPHVSRAVNTLLSVLRARCKEKAAERGAKSRTVASRSAS